MRWVPLAMSIMAFATAQAQAGDAVIATIDRATVLKLPKDAASIIIGNPSYFEVTLEDPRTLILFGKTAGQTNMIVWDAQRHDILNTPVVVMHDRGKTTLRVYSTARGASGANETTYACANGACVRISEGGGGAVTPLSPAPSEDSGSGGGQGGGPGTASPPPGGPGSGKGTAGGGGSGSGNQ